MIYGKRLRLREAVYKHGRFADDYIMSVLRSEWDARREGR